MTYYRSFLSSPGGAAGPSTDPIGIDADARAGAPANALAAGPRVSDLPFPYPASDHHRLANALWLLDNNPSGRALLPEESEEGDAVIPYQREDEAPGALAFDTKFQQSAEGPSVGVSIDHRSLSGLASYYNLPGNVTASGERFDGAAMTAAMTADKVSMGTTVKVLLKSDPSRSIVVRVNDRGPFARGTDGKALRPLVAHPSRIIDLTPEAFRQLTGSLSSGVVEVEVLLPK